MSNTATTTATPDSPTLDSLDFSDAIMAEIPAAVELDLDEMFKIVESIHPPSFMMDKWSKPLSEASKAVIAAIKSAISIRLTAAQTKAEAEKELFLPDLESSLKPFEIRKRHDYDNEPYNRSVESILRKAKMEITTVIFNYDMEAAATIEEKTLAKGPIFYKLVSQVKQITEMECAARPNEAEAIKTEQKAFWDHVKKVEYKNWLKQGEKEANELMQKKRAQRIKKAENNGIDPATLSQPPPFRPSDPNRLTGVRGGWRQPVCDFQLLETPNLVCNADQPDFTATTNALSKASALSAPTERRSVDKPSTSTFCERKRQRQWEGQSSPLVVKRPLRRKTCLHKSIAREHIAIKSGYHLSLEEYNNLATLGVGKLAVHTFDTQLSYEDASALANGHRFIPTPEPNTLLLPEAIEVFAKRLRWAWFFRHEKAKGLPKWYIPTGRELDEELRNPEVEKGLEVFKQRLLQDKPTSNSSNWPRYMQTRLNKLLQDPYRVVMLTDKNLGYAIVTTNWYKTQLALHMQDALIYKPTEVSADILVDQVQTTINHIRLKYHRYTTAKEREWLTQKQEVQIMPFYLLAKVHKKPWTTRPITPSWCWPTFHLSEIIADELQPYVLNAFTVLRDSKELLQILSTQEFDLPKDKGKHLYLLTADVTALYPNINTTRGVAAVKAELESYHRYRDDWGQARLAFISESLDYVLRANFVTVQGKTYQQINGTAMGTPLAPPYANLFLYNLEKPIIERWKLRKRLLLYKRYIDDVLAVFYGTKQELEAFRSEMNCLDQDIKLTWEQSHDSINFLDVTVFRNEDFSKTHKLHTKLYQKTLNEYLYLPNHSYHTKDMKKGFIRGEAIRYVRTCSLEKDYDNIRAQFTKRLMLRGYKLHFIETALSTVKYEQRPQYLEDKTTDLSKANLLFKIELNPTINLKHIRTELLAFTQTLSTLEDVTDALKEHIVVCQRVPPKLHEHINGARKRTLANS